MTPTTPTTAKLKQQDSCGRTLSLTLHVTEQGVLLLNIGVTARAWRGPDHDAKSILTTNIVLSVEDAEALAAVLIEHAAYNTTERSTATWLD